MVKLPLILVQLSFFHIFNQFAALTVFRRPGYLYLASPKILHCSIFRIMLLHILLITGQSTSFAQTALPPEAYGVWDRSDGSEFNSNDSNYNYLHGITIGMPWKDIQPNNDSTYKWDILQSALDRAASRNVYIYIGIGVGPESPEWIYAAGVPKVVTNDSNHEWPYYPYYPDTNYRKFYHTFIGELAKFIQNQPLGKLNKIAFIQVKTGCTGDECAYKGDAIDSNFALPNNGELWRTFRLESFNIYKKKFVDAIHPIALLFNNIEFEKYPIEWQWVLDSIGEGFGFKGSAYVRGHHLSEERTFTENWRKYSIDPQGLALFSRAEMDQSWTKPLYTINKELGFYWGAISGLNSGLSVWDITKSALVEAGTNNSIRETFPIFNKYANQVYPGTSTRAFIVLHEGLDASDTVKFPTSLYGSASQKNTARYTAICNNALNAKHGAKMDDLQSATLGQVAQRDNQTGYNDAGWQIWPTNYSRFITQIDPDKESIGLFRIGGTINNLSPIYARFARSFEHSSGRDTMYFKLHDKLFRFPAKKVTLSIIYYDNVAGSIWELKYDAGINNFRSAKVVTGTGSHTWKRENITVADAVMHHNGPNGADFALVNRDTTDDIFHSIEIEMIEPVSNNDDVYNKPTEFKLNQNYPNPFNPKTIIKFELPAASYVSLKVYNLLGQEITTLITRELSSGYHETSFNALPLPSGVYLYRIQAGEFIQTKKMILLK